VISLALTGRRRHTRVPARRRSAVRAERSVAPARAGHRAGRGAVPRPRAEQAEMRSFIGASAAIALAFVLALTYLAGSTGVATAGYEAQRLQATRDELRRQNSLLELEVAKLDAPARIEAEAKRLGLVRVPFIPVVQAEPLTARR
jgi:hypothetical protein